MEFSIIVPTINRDKEVKDLLNSLEKSTFQDFEIIIVDQNKSDLLDDIVSGFESLDIKHYKVNFSGVSRARNFGQSKSKGKIINFADDDAEFTENLLGSVSNKFKQTTFDVLFGKAIDKRTKTSSGTKFTNQPGIVNRYNLYNTTIEFTMFLKKDIFKEVGGFDETLGVGTEYGAEEGADFVLRCLALDLKLVYDPTILFYHPQKIFEFSEKERIRGFNYAKGFGRMVAKHVLTYKEYFELLRFIKTQIKSSIGLILFIFLLKKNKVKYYWACIKGRHLGFFRSLKDYR